MNSTKNIDQEKQFVAGCLAGDKQAWDRFVDTYTGLIYSTIIRTFNLLGFKNIHGITEDLFQDVFVSFLKDDCAKIKAFQWKNGCSLASWISVITRNLVFDFVRKKYSRNRIAISLPCDEGQIAQMTENGLLDETLLRKIEKKENFKLFGQALLKLPEADLHLIELIYYQEVPYDHAAKILSKSIDALYMQKKRIVDKIRKIIKKSVRL